MGGSTGDDPPSAPRRSRSRRREADDQEAKSTKDHTGWRRSVFLFSFKPSTTFTPAHDSFHEAKEPPRVLWRWHWTDFMLYPLSALPVTKHGKDNLLDQP